MPQSRPQAESRHQTVQIRKGRHLSPERGACVIELASMLAGEPFGDHPRSVCPVIAGFLRGYNDLLPDGQHDELYPYASLVVGTAAPRGVQRARARRLLEWADRGREPARRRRFYVRVQTWDLIVLPAVEAALRMDPERRRVAIAALLDELCAIGRPAGAPVPVAAHGPNAPVGPAPVASAGGTPGAR
jgi:hypothetical protein